MPDRAPGHGRKALVAGAFPIVAIGASAGGLEACQKFFDGVEPNAPMAFILVQHLDPTHGSMLVDLLSRHSALPVAEARDGVRVEPGHVYVIAPGSYLSVTNGSLTVSLPQARHGVRLPFDFLLASLAQSWGARTICVVLSGSGDDGSLGLKALKAAGGMVIAQDPDEAGYDGMPRSAILTGGVDLVLPIARMPEAITEAAAHMMTIATAQHGADGHASGGVLAQIIDRIRDATGHDFTLYKPGTLERRIERRMAMASVPVHRMDEYLARLTFEPGELDVLAKDLLIHVTSFFRDPKVFDVLAETVAVDLVRGRAPGDPIRIWTPACSTGEEAYSIAMVFREAIDAAGGGARLQVFASDLDPDAVATAREGLYPDTITAQVSPARLARFFAREEHGYRISPELRSAVVFTTQNLLTDPPFARLDLISCRNLLIYLRPEAQAKLVRVFHFALKSGGVLMLGGSETVGHADGRFAIISKPARLYRQVGRPRVADLPFIGGPAARARPAARLGTAPPMAASPSLAELCRRLVLEAHAPAAVLINRARECLYTLGPTDRYLKVAAGAPSVDLLAMARNGVRGKLALAIGQAFERKTTVTVAGGPLRRDGASLMFHVEARPVDLAGETYVLVCFLEAPRGRRGPAAGGAETEGMRVADLEAELEATKAELQTAVHGLEISNEEQMTINEEALSVNEEYQSANEELLTSKEELQSLNEELNALNSQLQETLDRQRTSSADLQNILYSTDMATVFLDADLRIRFFTPATRALFNVIAGDIGRPLADLRALAPDPDLLSDSKTMLTTLPPLAREIQTADGDWYLRRVMPYRGQGDSVEGVVITYTDITDRKQTSKKLEAATLAADNANRAKSRFLAAASHDLRQPLQTLTLIQGLLERKAQGEPERKLIALQEQCLNAMTGMLNTLLDINQIDAGIVQADNVDFPIETIFERLREEFAYSAQSKGLRFRIAPCSQTVTSDPALLEQILRNLISNALKYTTRGRVLVVCRRRADKLKIQVLDTGIGIHPSDQQSIFEEYHQVENVARERSRGLGLGLSIVKRLAVLLGHEIGVQSQAGRGSVFTLEVALVRAPAKVLTPAAKPLSKEPSAPAPPRRSGAILVVEDDPEVRHLLELILEDEGHHLVTAFDGASAVELVSSGTIRPDVILADYNLPGGMTGLDVAKRLREQLSPNSPVVVLTGDISAATLRAIAAENCIPLHKPVKPEVLSGMLQDLLAGAGGVAAPRRAIRPSGPEGDTVIYVVDDDAGVRDALRLVLAVEGLAAETFADCETFLAAYRPGRHACLLLDAYLHAGMDGLELLARLREAGDPLPVIMVTGEADVGVAVLAMKAGAADFIEKPVAGPALIESIARALEKSVDSDKMVAIRADATGKIGKLTARQREILDMVLAGHPSKNIAADLGISQRTVENHRAAIMQKTGSRSLPALARLALASAAPTLAGGQQ